MLTQATMAPQMALIVVFFFCSCFSWIEAVTRNLEDVFALEEKMTENSVSEEWSPRVIGGRPAEDREFPWMVALHYEGRFVCSSFLITPKVVMTAAHCVVFREGAEPPEKYNAYAGNVNRDGPDTEIQFSEIIAHKEYGEGTEYDIALMKTKEPVQLNDKVRTVCLPAQGSNSEDSIRQAMGWGVHQKGGRESSPVLMTLAQHVPTYKRCYRVYARLGIPVTKRHVCAGGDRDKGICFGDSGGPLVNLNGTRPSAIGVASFGSYLGCAVRGIPAVYTSTESYLDWIKENMGDDANDICYV